MSLERLPNSCGEITLIQKRSNRSLGGGGGGGGGWIVSIQPYKDPFMVRPLPAVVVRTAREEGAACSQVSMRSIFQKRFTQLAFNIGEGSFFILNSGGALEVNSVFEIGVESRYLWISCFMDRKPGIETSFQTTARVLLNGNQIAEQSLLTPHGSLLMNDTPSQLIGVASFLLPKSGHVEVRLVTIQTIFDPGGQIVLRLYPNVEFQPWQGEGSPR